MKAKLDEIRDRKSEPTKPATRNDPGHPAKRLKDDLERVRLVCFTPAVGSHILLPGTVIEGENATLSVVASNGATLEGVVVDVNDERYVSDENGRVVFVAASVAGTVVASLHALLDSTPPKAQVVSAFGNAAVPTVESAPAHVLAGDQAAISGKGFDGNAAANTVTIDGEEVPVLASSPSEIIVNVPQWTAVGRREVIVATQQGAAELRAVNVIRLGVQADTAVLMRGQKGKLQVTVTGTDEQVPLRIVNTTPQIITLTNGDTAEVMTSGGRDNHVALKVRGENPGAFRIAAEIAEPSR